ncbi:MAG: toll/interleukin-1 receptor domain-containing protein [Cyanobacteria bacterium J06634_5]
MKIFISYRRIDSSSATGRLFDRLAAHFGSGSVFKDVDVIPLGADFISTITQEIQQCDVVLAIIGPQWLSATDEKGHLRLDNPNDFVRLELESAFDFGIPVVPVLVNKAQLPSRKELPASIAQIASRNAVSVGHDPTFHTDLDRLIIALERLTERVLEQNPLVPTQTVPDIDPSELDSNLVFVSHSTSDRRWVEEEIVGLLEQSGIKSWYAKSSITTSAQWEREILRGLEACTWFLLVVSPRSAESEWIKDELFWAMHYRPTQIVPVIMEECDLWKFHIRLPRIQHVNFAESRQEARRLLIEAFSR